MWDLVKKYWDLVSGSLMCVALCVMSHFNIDTVQLIYSIIILFLLCIGAFRILRQSIEKSREKKVKERKSNLIDNMVDNQLAVKVVRIAQEPTKEGEKYGRLFISLWEETKGIMKKIRAFFDKYKGYLATIVLGLLTAVETYGGYINELCGGVLMVKGVPVLPFVTLILTVIIGILSNGFTKEQVEKIHALFSKSSTAELVQAEIKKSLKENAEKHKQFVKILATKEAELENLKSEREGLTNTYNAKKEMYVMIPQLATEEDVQLASNALCECNVKISAKEAEIEEVKTTISNLATTIGALKSQL